MELKKFGIRNTRFSNAFKCMKSRCGDKNNKHYGGKGIAVIWECYEDFVIDMYASFKIHNEANGDYETTIDRIDSNGNYCKENCRWATWKEQNKNRECHHEPRRVVLLDGKIIPVRIAAKIIGIEMHALISRAKRSGQFPYYDARSITRGKGRPKKII